MRVSLRNHWCPMLSAIPVNQAAKRSGERSRAEPCERRQACLLHSVVGKNRIAEKPGDKARTMER